MGTFLDRYIEGENVYPFMGAGMDNTYPGVDLTQKFAEEISGNPWAWIKARIQNEDFDGIHVKDYIPITTTNNVTLNMEIAGINTYKNYYGTVSSHIDFISRELWPTTKRVNPVNFNNGHGDISEHPWLCTELFHFLNSTSGTVPNGTEIDTNTGEVATTTVDYTTSGVYYYLPDAVKNVIVEKYLYLEKRYTSGEILTEDNSGAGTNIGKLWLPTEMEVYGTAVRGDREWGVMGSAVQYPIFAHNMNRVKFRNGSRYNWWLLSPRDGNSTSWCGVNAAGIAYAYAASATLGAPVCFRVS